MVVARRAAWLDRWTCLAAPLVWNIPGRFSSAKETCLPRSTIGLRGPQAVPPRVSGLIEPPIREPRAYTAERDAPRRVTT